MSISSDGDPKPRKGESDSLWDEWSAARKLDPRLTPREFLARRGPVEEEALAELELLLAFERRSPPSPLVDAVTLDLGAADVRFAGFRLLDTLGQGTSGIVYLARDERARGARGDGHPDGAAKGPLVALKVLNPLLAATPERRDTILHEAEVARSLDHEGIVRVLASGLERGYAWIAAEYVEGDTLERLIGKQARAVEREALALEIGLQLAQALAHAHARGVVHRDLKPSNLIFSSGRRVKVLDFGLARTQGTAFSMSRTGEMVGTPLYMAPEQARGDEGIGPWTDVYAAGLVLWEIASGRRLDQEEALHSLLARIARGKFRLRARDLRPIRPALAAVIRRCLEPHPADRYQDCVALLADLEDVRANRPPRMGALSTARRWMRACGRNKVRSAATVAGIVCVAFGSHWLWWNWPQDVTIETVDDGKVLWVDGERPQLSIGHYRLRPGKHRVTAQFTGALEKFTIEFEVLPRTPKHLLAVVSPWHGVPELVLGNAASTSRVAWVVVATPAERIQLSIDGGPPHATDGVVSFKLPLGTHVLEASAPGLIPWKQSIDLSTQDLCLLPFVMDPDGSPWRTVVLYSPIDYTVRSLVKKNSGLRLYAERESLTSNAEFSVRKVYLGPDEDLMPGTFSIEIPLAGEVGDIEVEFPWGPMVEDSLQGTSEFLRVDMGRDEQHLHPVVEVCRDAGKFPPPIMRTLGQGDGIPAASDIPFFSPSEGALLPVRSELAGAKSLTLQWTAGGVLAGEGMAYAFAMRTNALPMRTVDGKLIWNPAATLRIRCAH